MSARFPAGPLGVTPGAAGTGPQAPADGAVWGTVHQLS